MLQAQVEGMSTVGKVALGNQILGDAQMMLSHARLAGAYYARAYAAEPSAQRLWLMASSNDDGGDYELALGQYLELVSWPGPEADEYPRAGTLANSRRSLTSSEPLPPVRGRDGGLLGAHRPSGLSDRRTMPSSWSARPRGHSPLIELPAIR